MQLVVLDDQAHGLDGKYGSRISKYERDAPVMESGIISHSLFRALLDLARLLTFPLLKLLTADFVETW